MHIPTLPTQLDAGEIARSIAAGDLSAREVVDAHLARIKEVDDRLNAVVLPRVEDAREEADAADAARHRGEELGPLAGVPITVGSSWVATGVEVADGSLVAALREAGAIVVGHTNVPGQRRALETDHPRFGRTSNPWDLRRTPGGGSGADAAVVAAGGAALALGADVGGGLRLPATWCGLATIKPTSQRLPGGDSRGRAVSGSQGLVAQPGPIARSTADVALALGVLVDAVLRRPSGASPPVALGDPAGVDVATLRVAVLAEIGGCMPSPAVRRAIRDAAGVLVARNAVVEAWDPAPDTATGIELAGRLGLRTPGRVRGRVWQVRTRSADELLHVLGDRLAYEAAFLAGLDAGGYDALLCPASPVPAPEHGHTRHLVDASLPAVLVDVLGMPAGVVPVTRVRPGEESDRAERRDKAVTAARRAERGSAGLPVGVQIVARHWREDVVLAVMGAIEGDLVGDPDYPQRPPI